MESKINKYKWDYVAEHLDGGDINFKIIPDGENPKPTELYKFYSLTQYAIDGLLNGYIYATHPCQFNDLYDCYEELVTFDDNEWNKSFLHDFLGKELAENIIASNDTASLATYAQRNFREIVYRKWGVYSMTSNPNNILMWSYYTNNQGFSICFDFSKFPFKFRGPFPVNYQSNIEKISAKETGIQLAVLYQTNIKHEGWQHESEWRLLIDAPGEDMIAPSFEMLQKLGGHNRRFNYPLAAIKHICLGNRFFQPEEIKEIDKMTLQLTLKPEAKQKHAMLSFLDKNSIESYIGLRHSAFKSIHFRGGKFSQIDSDKFKFVAA